MNQEIHEANKKKIRQQQGIGIALAVAGLIVTGVAFLVRSNLITNRGTEGMAASVITSVRILPFATYAGFVWYFYRELLSFRKLSFVAMWKQGWGLIGEYELAGAFFKSLGNGYLFMAAAAFFAYRIISRIEAGRS